jgi:hypothetical protein
VTAPAYRVIFTTDADEIITDPFTDLDTAHNRAVVGITVPSVLHAVVQEQDPEDPTVWTTIEEHPK